MDVAKIVALEVVKDCQGSVWPHVRYLVLFLAGCVNLSLLHMLGNMPFRETFYQRSPLNHKKLAEQFLYEFFFVFSTALIALHIEALLCNNN